MLKEERIIVNVGGMKYEFVKKNLKKFFDMFFGSGRKNFFYDVERKEYFFDCDLVIFKNIVDFYWYGSFYLFVLIVCCMEVVLDELKYFGIL